MKRWIALGVLACIACSRTGLDAPIDARSKQTACAAPLAVHACPHLTIKTGPSAFATAPNTLMQALPRNGALDLLFFDEVEGPSPHGVARLSTSGALQLGPLTTLTDRVYSLGLVGDRVAALYPISDAQDYTHAHFQIYDSSYEVLSDVDIDDGHHSCRWEDVACNDERCFAVCNGNQDGPKFVAFDSNGARTFGPDQQSAGAVAGVGHVVVTGCGFVTTTQDTYTSTSMIRFAAPDESAPTFLLDRDTVFLKQVCAWPYDASSVVWPSWNGDTMTLERMNDLGQVTVLRSDVVSTLGVELVPTSFGLVVIDAAWQQPTTTFHLRIITPDGEVSADTTFTAGYVSEAGVGETPDGIALAWTQDNDGSLYGALLACE